MPDGEKDKGFDDLVRDLEDDIFGIKQTPEEPPGVTPPSKEEPERRQTLPTLVDKETANKILEDFMRKDKNQRKYDVMGVELMFKPYWFFTYTCEMIVRDNNKNITDSEEIGGRIAVDAINGSLADYLQDLLDHEPIETVDLADEMTQLGGGARILEPKISEDRLEKFVQQKISGVLKADKENVSVAGFELIWSPVYRFWLTIKKKTHNVQIDGCGGYPINYDDIPLKEKTWADRIADDIELLKNPKKWREFLKKKGKAIRSGVAGAKGSSKKPGLGTVEAVLGLIILVLFLYGLSQRPPDFKMVLISIILAVVLFWYMNHQRPKPLLPLPPPPFVGGPEGGQ